MFNLKRTDYRLTLLLAVTSLAVAGAIFLPAVSQDQAYHTFADRVVRMGIPNFWNVISNIPFLLVGLAGLRELSGRAPAGILPGLLSGYRVFFVGMALIAPGSAYYHYSPDNATLVWDRLPMTIAFMAFLSTIIGEHVSVSWGRRLLWPLIATGALSVLYWYLTEIAGRGDLRSYALVQFLPMLVIPLILLLFPSPFSGRRYVWCVLYLYLISKYAEILDGPIHRLFYPVSGHALKHLIAALGGYSFLLAMRRRR